MCWLDSNTTTKTPPQKKHHTNTTTQTPPQKHHHKNTATKTPPQHSFTTLHQFPSPQHFSTTHLYNIPYNTSLQHFPHNRCEKKTTTPLQLRTTLLQYYSVLQSTIPVLLRTTRTTKYYSSTALCTTKYYSVRQSTTPILLPTTKYYSNITPYYKVLLQYYSVLQSTTQNEHFVRGFLNFPRNKLPKLSKLRLTRDALGFFLYTSV